MRLLRKFTVMALALIALAVMPKRAEAALLTIVDAAGPTTWTLSVQTGCTTCAITLQAVFTDPDGAGAGVNGYTGDYINSVQWVIAGADPTAAGFNGTNAGTTAQWSFSLDASLNNNGCTGGAQDAVCGQWIGGGVPNGFGPIVNGSTLFWTFSTTFASALPGTLTGGNIRAAFNGADGKNAGIFSPDGGNFGGGGGTSGGGGSTVPEPASMLLFGLAATATAYRARRRAAR
jgi:PEP-CTERM motif